MVMEFCELDLSHYIRSYHIDEPKAIEIIKQVMKETGAVFGGEHSGHYYFRDNYRADSGILALLVGENKIAMLDLTRKQVALAHTTDPVGTFDIDVKATTP